MSIANGVYISILFFLSTLKKTFFIDKPRLINYRERIDELHYNASVVHIYFKELGVVKYSRDELFGLIDVIGEEEDIVVKISWRMNPFVSYFCSLIWRGHRTLHGILNLEPRRAYLLLHNQTICGLEEREEDEEKEGRDERRRMTWIVIFLPI